MTNPIDIKFRSDMVVELIDQMGSDASVARAARVSTLGADSRFKEGELEGLIGYLMRSGHGSPFEQNAFTFYIEMPIFVMRELVRHRIASFNETSGRYRQLGSEFYLPSEDRALHQVGKAGAYEFVMGSRDQIDGVRIALTHVYREAYAWYEKMLDLGVAREVARMCLPVGIYTQVYMTINARSLMNLLSLRVRSNVSARPSYPQAEIQMVAVKMEEIFAELMPVTWEAFVANGRIAP